MSLPLSYPDTIALLIFFGAWLAYARFARVQARRKATLSSLIRLSRERWMRAMLRRENRIGDANIVGNVKSVATFFASTTVLILAGVVTALSASDSLVQLLSDMHMGDNHTTEALQFKLFILAMVFIYAFFKFTWCIRQHIICGIQIGAAPWDPNVEGKEELPPHLDAIALRAAKISDLAGHDFNNGLRAYYFSLALLAWLINIWFFLAGTLWVVVILYFREFRSRAVQILREEHHLEHEG